MKLLKDLFITAYESGYSNYWTSVEFNPTGNDIKRLQGGASKSEVIFNHIWNGGSIEIMDAEDDTEVLGILTKDAMLKGLKMLKTESYFGEELTYDAIDADSWLQFSVMGEIVFG